MEAPVHLLSVMNLSDEHKVIITPHISGMSVNYDNHCVELLAENARRYLAGKPLLNQVSRTLGY